MTSDEARHVPDRAFRVAQPSLPQPLLWERFRPGTKAPDAIEPAAKVGLHGEWVCDERRSTGVKT